ncbi:hypothetical protein PR048_013837 [Dryococelus australis]|uniref:Uncharacterized protein n=1 Tax=Dryococelus australis TaxID=614101 RepID=A0ABQ9HU43_9NEOP|nr:hypothetical protein PR048_013837 [Dryococelus australis]
MHLQERINDEASALTAKMKPNLYVSKMTVNIKGPKCVNCGKVGHIKKYCPEDASTDKTKAYLLGSFNRNHRSKSKNETLLLTALNISSENLNEWCVDSGATSHMTPSTWNKSNLLSVSKIAEKGHCVVFDHKKCTIYSEDNIVATATQRRDLDNQQTDCGMIGWDTSTELGMDLLKEDMADGISFSGEKDGPFKGAGGKRVGDHTRKVFVYIIRSKVEVFEKCRKFKAQVEKQTGKQIKILRTDNGSEYINRDFKNFQRNQGIKHELTIPYSPEQNGLAERTNHTLVEKVRWVMKKAGSDEKMWAEAVNTAAYLANRSPHKATDVKTPEEWWCGRKVNLAHLLVFGCIAYSHIEKQKCKKWDSKSYPYIYL